MKSLLVPFPKEEIVYGKIIKFKKLTNKPGFYEIIIDVVNKIMFAYDMKLLEGQNINYSPYFYFLSFTTNNENLLTNLHEFNQKQVYFKILLSKDKSENQYPTNLVLLVE